MRTEEMNEKWNTIKNVIVIHVENKNERENREGE